MNEIYLHIANGNINNIKECLYSGCDINFKNNNLTEPTYLLYAISYRKFHIMQFLLKYGADPTICNNKGETIIEIIKKHRPKNQFDVMLRFRKWIKDELTQVDLLDKYPSLYKSLKQTNFLHKNNKKKYIHLDATTELNLL